MRIRDVNQDDQLFERYEHRIPVVLAPDGSVIAEGRIDFWKLLRGVLAAKLRAGFRRRP